jgi:hypothetical protein
MFKVKIAIVPDGANESTHQQGIATVTEMFTPDLEANPNFLNEMPRLDGMEMVTLSAPRVKNVNHDYSRLMELVKLSNCQTFLIYIRSTTVSTVKPNNLIKLIYDLCTSYLDSVPAEESYSDSDSESSSDSGSDSGSDSENGFGNNFDLMYLAKWSDRCDQFKITGSVFNAGVNLVETVRPNGLQAVLISPGGAIAIRHLLARPVDYPVSLALTQLIGSGKLQAITTTPSMMNYDVTAAAAVSDYTKSHECAEPPAIKGCKTPEGSNLSLFIFILMVLIVVAVFYFLVVVVRVPGTDNRNMLGNRLIIGH